MAVAQANLQRAFAAGQITGSEYRTASSMVEARLREAGASTRAAISERNADRRQENAERTADMRAQTAARTAAVNALRNDPEYKALNEQLTLLRGSTRQNPSAISDLERKIADRRNLIYAEMEYVPSLPGGNAPRQGSTVVTAPR
jgi:hypothetical protein